MTGQLSCVFFLTGVQHLQLSSAYSLSLFLLSVLFLYPGVAVGGRSHNHNSNMLLDIADTLLLVKGWIKNTWVGKLSVSGKFPLSDTTWIFL